MRGDRMEYEIYEPDPEDEYYDQVCAAAYERMFNEGRKYNAEVYYDDYPYFVGSVSCG